MIFIFITLIFLIINLLLLIYTKPKIRKNILLTNNNFSIIISSKNEELNLPNTLNFIKRLNYNQNNYEIIFVDDNSTDNTKKIILDEIKNIENAKYLLAEKKVYSGKKGAIDLGIKNAKYENIIITDADCNVQPNLLNEINTLINNNVDFIIGLSPFYLNDNIISKLSCFENLRTNLMIIFSTKIKLPYTAVARNLCFKKKFYFEIGGFNSLQDTLSGDDDLLLREAINKKLKIDVLYSKDSFVYSYAKNSLKEYINQKLRHTSTSYYYSLKQLIFPTIWHVVNLLMFVSPLFLIINWFYFIPFFVKLAIDIFIVKFNQSKFNYKFTLLEIIYLQIIYELLIIFKFPLSYFYKKRW